MRSRSYDIGEEIRMHSLTVDRFTLLNYEKVVVVMPVTCVEDDVTGSEAMLALNFCTLSEKCLDETTEEVITKLDSWQYSTWMSI